MSNVFFLKYCTINYILSFLYIMKNLFGKLNSVITSTSTMLLTINIGHY